MRSYVVVSWLLFVEQVYQQHLQWATPTVTKIFHRVKPEVVGRAMFRLHNTKFIASSQTKVACEKRSEKQFLSRSPVNNEQEFEAVEMCKVMGHCSSEFRSCALRRQTAEVRGKLSDTSMVINYQG